MALGLVHRFGVSYTTYRNGCTTKERQQFPMYMLPFFHFGPTIVFFFTLSAAMSQRPRYGGVISPDPRCFALQRSLTCPMYGYFARKRAHGLYCRVAEVSSIFLS